MRAPKAPLIEEVALIAFLAPVMWICALFAGAMAWSVRLLLLPLGIHRRTPAKAKAAVFVMPLRGQARSTTTGQAA